METLAAGVWRSMQAVRPDAVLIAHGGSNKALPLWFPTAMLRLLVLVVRRKVEYVLVGDALAYAVFTPLLRLFRVRHATMIMGLDVTFENRLYRAVVHPLLRHASRIIAISQATADAAIGFGVNRDRIEVVRLGVQAPAVTPADRAAARVGIRQVAKLSPDSRVVVTLGRLVRRKGARWFVAEVMPTLDASIHYVLAGDGPERDEIISAAKSAGVEHRVHLLGLVDDDVREQLLIGADLFVQPNIPVAGDMEGFGLVTIEAALRGLPVVAADLEGIKDAVVNGKTGILLPTGAAQEWSARITELFATDDLASLGEQFRVNADAMYSEAAMGSALSRALVSVTAG